MGKPVDVVNSLQPPPVQAFDALLAKVDGQRLGKLDISSQAQALVLQQRLEANTYTVGGDSLQFKRAGTLFAQLDFKFWCQSIAISATPVLPAMRRWRM